jgi:hypothetical protein
VKNYSNYFDFAKLNNLQIFAFAAVVCLTKAEYDHHHEHSPVGYSYSKFSGPVSGPAREIHTKDAHGHSVDYESKPDYAFEYGIEDPKSQVSQFRKENRQDDAVTGEYSYTDPFGHVRLVKYTADKLHGFRAEIYVDGKLETPHSSSSHHQTHNHHEDDHEDHGKQAHQQPHEVHHQHHQQPHEPQVHEDSSQYDESSEDSGSQEDY